MIYNGFNSAETLKKARELLKEACSFPRAALVLEGLDVFCEKSGTIVRIESCGVIFANPTDQDLSKGITGSLGRFLLKVAHSSPARDLSLPIPAWIDPTIKKESNTNQIEQTVPSLSELNATSSTPLAPVDLTSQQNSTHPLDDLENFVFDEDEDFFDEEEEEPENYTTLGHSFSQPEIVTPIRELPAMTQQEIFSMRGAFLLSNPTLDPFFLTLTQQNQATFHLSDGSWDVIGGSIKKKARLVCSSQNLQLEISPNQSLFSKKTFAIFPIEPAFHLKDKPDEDVNYVEWDKALQEIYQELDQALILAKMAIQSCNGGVVFLCGWGSHAAEAKSRAIQFGFLEF